MPHRLEPSVGMTAFGFHQGVELLKSQSGDFGDHRRGNELHELVDVVLAEIESGMAPVGLHPCQMTVGEFLDADVFLAVGIGSGRFDGGEQDFASLDVRFELAQSLLGFLLVSGEDEILLGAIASNPDEV